MTMRLKVLVLSSLLLSASAVLAEGDAARGEQSFSKCSACHNIDSPRTRLGPHLMGVVGRPAGSVPDYKYSQAMIDAGAQGMVWTDEKLKEFLYSPKKSVPGTAMRFFGLWSESEIDDLIAYMKTVQAPK